MNFINDRQRKAVFASMNGVSNSNKFSMFSERPASKFRFKRGYEANVSDEELQNIVDKDIDISTLPKGTVKYYAIKDFGVQGAIDRAKDDMFLYLGDDIDVGNEPIFDNGVVVGQALVVSKKHRRIDAAPKRADISDYEFLDENEISKIHEYTDRSKIMEEASSAVSANDALYDMYLDMGGSSLDRDMFLKSYRNMSKERVLPHHTIEIIINAAG